MPFAPVDDVHQLNIDLVNRQDPELRDNQPVTLQMHPCAVAQGGSTQRQPSILLENIGI
jgi:hypothetical protein